MTGTTFGASAKTLYNEVLRALLKNPGAQSSVAENLWIGNH